MPEPNRDRDNSGGQDIIDEALRLVDALQRKLIVAGVRRGVSAATAAPPKGDVWEEAVGEPPDHQSSCDVCPICRLMDAMRGSGVDVSDVIERAGSSLRAAAEEVRASYERSQTQNGSGDGAQRSE